MTWKLGTWKTTGVAFACLALSASACQAELIAFDSFATTGVGAYTLGSIQNQNPTVGLDGFLGPWNGGTTTIAAADGGLMHDLTPGTTLDGQVIAATFTGRALLDVSAALSMIAPMDGSYYMSVLLQKSEFTEARDMLVGLGPLEDADSDFGSSQATYIGIFDGGIAFTPGMANFTQLMTADNVNIGETYFALMQFDFSTSGSDTVTATIYDGSSEQVAIQMFPNLSLDGDIGRFGLATRDFSPVAIADEWRFGTELSDVMITGPACDFNGDDLCDITDLNDLLSVGPVEPQGVPAAGMEAFDLTGDGVIDNADVDEWLAIAATENALASPYKRADANLDGVVDGQDFILWNDGKFTSTLLWDGGDFNGDGFADGVDFIQWNENKFTSSDAVTAVPEPVTGWLLTLLVASGGVVRVRRRR